MTAGTRPENEDRDDEGREGKATIVNPKTSTHRPRESRESPFDSAGPKSPYFVDDAALTMSELLAARSSQLSCDGR